MCQRTQSCSAKSQCKCNLALIHVRSPGTCGALELFPAGDVCVCIHLLLGDSTETDPLAHLQPLITITLQCKQSMHPHISAPPHFLPLIFPTAFLSLYT